MGQEDLTVYPKDVIPFAIEGSSYGLKMAKGLATPLVFNESVVEMVGDTKKDILTKLKKKVMTMVKDTPMAIVNWVFNCSSETPALCKPQAAGRKRRKTRRKKRRKKRRYLGRKRRRRTKKKYIKHIRIRRGRTRRRRGSGHTLNLIKKSVSDDKNIDFKELLKKIRSKNPAKNATNRRKITSAFSIYGPEDKYAPPVGRPNPYALKRKSGGKRNTRKRRHQCGGGCSTCLALALL